MTRRKTKVVVITDKMQKGYRYTLSEAVGKNFDPRFKPELSPKEMLRLGVFGGKYMTDCRKEFLSSGDTRLNSRNFRTVHSRVLQKALPGTSGTPNHKGSGQAG